LGIKKSTPSRQFCISSTFGSSPQGVATGMVGIKSEARLEAFKAQTAALETLPMLANHRQVSTIPAQLLASRFRVAKASFVRL
jgi:hypothetical protein